MLVVNRLMYPVVNGILGSLSCIPFSKAQDPRFHKQNWYPGFQNSYSSTWGDKKLQMAYCDEKKQTKGIEIYQTQPTDVTLFVGVVFSCFWHVRWQAPPKYLGASSKQTNYNAYMLITKVTFSLAHVLKHSAFFAVTTVA